MYFFNETFYYLFVDHESTVCYVLSAGHLLFPDRLVLWFPHHFIQQQVQKITQVSGDRIWKFDRTSLMHIAHIY